MKNKEFDCVEMMRKCRDKMTEELSGLTVDEKMILLQKEFPHIKQKEQKKLVEAF